MAPRATHHCPSCNVVVDPSATYCNHCGRSLPTQLLSAPQTQAGRGSPYLLVVTVVVFGIMIGLVGVIGSRATRNTIQPSQTPITSIIPTLTPANRIFDAISQANQVYPYAGGIDNPDALNMDHTDDFGGFTQPDDFGGFTQPDGFGNPLPTAVPLGLSRLTTNNKNYQVSYRLDYNLPNVYPGYAGFALQFNTNQDISKYRFLVVDLGFRDKNAMCGLFIEDETGNKEEILSGLGIIYNNNVSVTTNGNRQIITIDLRYNYKKPNKEIIRRIGFETRTEFSRGSGWFEVYRVELVHD